MLRASLAQVWQLELSCLSVITLQASVGVVGARRRGLRHLLCLQLELQSLNLVCLSPVPRAEPHQRTQSSGTCKLDLSTALLLEATGGHKSHWRPFLLQFSLVMCLLFEVGTVCPNLLGLVASRHVSKESSESFMIWARMSPPKEIIPSWPSCDCELCVIKTDMPKSVRGQKWHVYTERHL